MLSISKNTTYLELIAEICYQIETEKTFYLDASKLSQEVLLVQKWKLDTQVSAPKQNNNGNGNGKKSKNGNQWGNNGG